MTEISAKSVSDVHGIIQNYEIEKECQQSWTLGMRQHFNTQNRHGPNPEYNCVILVFVTSNIQGLK
jgi:hypothetical protein